MKPLTILALLLAFCSFPSLFSQDSTVTIRDWDSLSREEKKLHQLKQLMTLQNSFQPPTSQDAANVSVPREVLVQLFLEGFAQSKVIEDLKKDYPSERANIEERLKKAREEAQAVLNASSSQ